MRDADSDSLSAGVIFNVARYSTHDGPGIRTTVFFKGCPLNCWWCHNPESQSPTPQLIFREDRCIHCFACVKNCPHHALAIIDDSPAVLIDACELSGECVRACYSGAREIIGKKMTAAEVMTEIERDTVFYDESGGGVTFSGGEPFMQPRILNSLLKLCKERMIHTAVETCGFVDSEIYASASPYVDQYLYDLKIIQDEKHRRFTRVSNGLILRNLRELARSHEHVIVRFPVIPSVNDDEENVSLLGEFVSSLRKVDEVDVLPYHELGISKYKRLGARYRMREIKPPSNEGVARIAEQLRGYGLNVKIGG